MIVDSHQMIMKPLKCFLHYFYRIQNTMPSNNVKLDCFPFQKYLVTTACIPLPFIFSCLKWYLIVEEYIFYGGKGIIHSSRSSAIVQKWVVSHLEYVFSLRVERCLSFFIHLSTQVYTLISGAQRLRKFLSSSLFLTLFHV